MLDFGKSMSVSSSYQHDLYKRRKYKRQYHFLLYQKFITLFVVLVNQRNLTLPSQISERYLPRDSCRVATEKNK